MGFLDWLSKKKKPKEHQESVSKSKEDTSVQVAQHERITTIEQARATYQQADASYKKGDFNGAIALYDKLLDTPLGLLNPYEVRKVRAMAYCNAGRFSEAEEELKQLLDVLISYGGSTSSSSVRYWYLVARYKGDKKRAMDEFVKS
jgi:tetratricopeptide (TPR) repeat protein